MLAGMEFGAAGARAAWASLAGLPRLDDLQVVVDPESWLAPHGWIGIVAIGTTITVSVPRPELESPVTSALRTLTSDEATTPEIVTRLIPPTRATLGPATLFYPPAGLLTEAGRRDEAGHAELSELIAAANAEDLEESGIASIEHSTFVSRTADGTIAAACGYHRWPNNVAHLAVLTHPAHRRRGHGRRAARSAMQCALDVGLLPQWRARPIASQALARSIGLTAIGTQLCLQPA